jgi:hypothetical protein
LEAFEIDDADLNGLELKACKGTTISGTIVIDADQAPEAASRLASLKLVAHGARPDFDVSTSEPAGFSIIRKGNEFIEREVAVASDGRFKLHGFTSGPVELSLKEDDLPWSHHFSIVRVEHSAVRPRNQIDITAGEALTGVRVVVKYRNAALRGEIEVKGGQIPAGMSLEYVARRADDPSDWRSWVFFGTSFSIMDMAPGKYEVYILGDRKRISESQWVIVTNENEARLTFTLDPAVFYGDASSP